jgi:protein-tyrosine phosphatase
MLLDLNRDMVSNTDAFLKIFKILLDEPQNPMLFHCMAGKDRTGVVAALILSALGVPREVIEQDYLYTNQASEEMKKGFEAIGYTMPKHIDQAVVIAMYEARIEYIQAYFDEIESRFGNVDSYLLEALGLESEDINLLRSHLLE